MKFYCFPRKQNHFAIYSSLEVFRSKLFSDFLLQASPKNSIFFRARNTGIGHVLGHLFTMEVDVPDKMDSYVGMIKEGRILLISLVNGRPEMVWRKKDGSWIRQEFIGYQLISSYSYKEFLNKRDLIKRSLEKQWDLVKNDPSNIHGDFTHFNILIGTNEEIHFIDRKDNQNSILLDFFYFYAYLRQCLSRCSTLSKADETRIIEELERLIHSVCKQDWDKMKIDLEAIIIPSTSGLLEVSKEKSLIDFRTIFQY